MSYFLHLCHMGLTIALPLKPILSALTHQVEIGPVFHTTHIYQQREAEMFTPPPPQPHKSGEHYFVGKPVSDEQRNPVGA